MLWVKQPMSIPKKLIYRRNIFFYWLLIGLYFFLLLLSVFNSDHIKEAFIYYLDVSFLLVLLLPLMIIINDFHVDEYFVFLSKVLIIAGIIFTIPVVLSVLGGGNRGYFSLGGPNVTTRFIFFALCSSVFLQKNTNKGIYNLTTALFLAGIVFIGSRGGLVGAILTLTTLFLIHLFFNKKKLSLKIKFSFNKMFFLGSAIGIFILMYEDIRRVFMGRFINVTFKANGEIYTSGRDYLYEYSIQMIRERPILGHGINSFYYRTGELYPHNIALEMMNNLGVFGLLFLLLFLIYSMYLIFKFRKTNLYIFSGLPLYIIIVQMFSGSIYDFRFYFFWGISLLFFQNAALKLEPIQPKINKKKRVKKRIVWSN